MSLDLVAVLAGEPAVDAPRPDPGDVVTRMRCSCGTVVALLARSAGQTWLWRAPYRHTPRGAAAIVTDVALEDFEHLAAEGDEDALLVGELFDALDDRDPVEVLAEILPPLRMPARLRNITGVAEELSQIATERGPGLAPPRAAYMTAGCGRCRRVLDVGDAVVELEPAPAPAAEVVVTDPPDLGVQRMGYGWPDSGRAGRVALYRTLSDALH